MCVTSRPNSSMRPAVTGKAPATRLNSVVLPAPFGPMSARRSPGRTASSTPSTARSPPNAFDTRARRSASGSLRGDSLTVLAGRIVATVERPLHVLVGLVLPELADRRIRRDHRVLQLAADTLDLADVDVLDGVAEVIHPERAARGLLQIDLPQRRQHRITVLDLAARRFDGLDDPARVRVGRLRVVRGDLAGRRLEGLVELHVGRIVEGLGVVQRGDEADRLVAHLR